jgi:hypothetical protein
MNKYDVEIALTIEADDIEDAEASVNDFLSTEYERGSYKITFVTEAADGRI